MFCVRFTNPTIQFDSIQAQSQYYTWLKILRGSLYMNGGVEGGGRDRRWFICTFMLFGIRFECLANLSGDSVLRQQQRQPPALAPTMLNAKNPTAVTAITQVEVSL